MYSGPNPFRFGDLALDEAFTDREASVAELVADMRNGQNVVALRAAPVRQDVARLARRATRRSPTSISVAYCDLMKTPTKERFAAALAKTIFDDLASPDGRPARAGAGLFRGLRIVPQMGLDPEHGSLTLHLHRAAAARHRRDDRAAVRDAAADRRRAAPPRRPDPRRVPGDREARRRLPEHDALDLPDPARGLTHLSREPPPHPRQDLRGPQPGVLAEREADRDRDDPARTSSARSSPIASTRPTRASPTSALDRLVGATQGHPYATQELAYYTWQEVASGAHAFVDHVEAALENVLRSENRHFSRIWEDATEHQRLLLIALVDGPQNIYTVDFRESYGFPSNSYVQRAVKTLVAQELVGQSRRPRVSDHRAVSRRVDQARAAAVRARLTPASARSAARNRPASSGVRSSAS